MPTTAIEIPTILVVIIPIVFIGMTIMAVVSTIGLRRLRNGIDDIFEDFGDFTASVVNNFTEKKEKDLIVQNDIPRKFIMDFIEKVTRRRQKMDRISSNGYSEKSLKGGKE